MAIQGKPFNRLFTVGCSYTEYNWPTYADLLSPDFNKSYNYGKAGAGNEYIFNSCNYIFNNYKPKEDDLLIVQWSGVGRLDTIFYEDTVYRTCGNLDWQDVYPKEYVKKYFNIVQSAYLLISFAKSIKALAEKHKVNLITFNMLDPWFDLFFGEPFNTTIFDTNLKYIQDYYPFKGLEECFKEINAYRSFEEFCWEHPQEKPIYNSYNNEVQEETHPSPLQHLKFAQQLNKDYSLNLKNIESKELLELTLLYQNVYENENLSHKLVRDLKLDEYFVPEDESPHMVNYQYGIFNKLFNANHNTFTFNVDPETWTQL